MKNNKSTLLLMTLLAVNLILFLTLSCGKSGQTQKTSSTAFSAQAPVKVYKVEPRRISEWITYTGTLEAQREITITPEIAGKIARIYVDEGDKVSEGQVLAELETESIKLQLRQAEAAEAVSRANFEDAKKNMERMDRLLNEKAVSETQYEKIKLAYEAATAQLEQARAALALARHALNVSIMRAPFSGIISSRNARVGDVINPMMGSFSPTAGVLKLVDYSRIKVVVQATQEDVLKLSRGQEARLSSRTIPGREFKGVITRVNLAADPATKKFRVEAIFDNHDLALRPGTFSEVIFEVKIVDQALVVPQKAVIEGGYVFVISNSKAYRKKVVLGIQNSEMAQVIEGLTSGDIVVAEGNFGLEDGMSVEIKGEVGQ